MPKISLLGQFRGYNTEKSIQEIPPDYLGYAENLLVINGAIQKRKKFSLISTTVSSTMAPNFWEYVYTSLRYHFYKRNSSGYGYFFRRTVTTPLDTESSKFTTAVTADTNRFIDFVEAGEILYLFDDSTQGQKAYIDTSTTDFHVEEIGLAPPGQPGAASDTGNAGAFPETGTISYKATWIEVVAGVAINIESDGSAERTFSLVATTDQVTVPRPSSPPAHATHWGLYRKDPSSSEWYWAVDASLPNGILVATTTYQDDGNDLDTQRPVPTRNTQSMITPWYGALFKRRLWVADGVNGSTLKPSELDQYEYFPSDLLFVVGNAAEPFTRLIALTNSLVIFKRDSVWSIDGDNVNNFRLQRRLGSQNNPFGSYSPACTIEYAGSLYWQNCAGIWRWELGGRPINIGRMIWKDFSAAIIAGHVTDWIAQIDPTHGHIWFAYRDGSYHYVYDPEANEFLGTAALEDVVGVGITGKYNNNPRLCLQAETKFYAYNQPTAAVEQAASETTFQVAGFLGMNIGSPLTKKQYRHIKMTDFEVIGPSVGGSETILVRVLKPLENIYGTAIGSYALSLNTELLKALDYHERALSIGIYQTNCSVSKFWSWTGFELEVETVGSH